MVQNHLDSIPWTKYLGSTLQTRYLRPIPWVKIPWYKYHGPNHGYHPYGEGQHKVMLGIRFPDGSHAGKDISSTVRLIDIAPTFAEYFKLNWGAEFDGKSLLPLLAGEQEEEKRLVYIETGVSEKKYWNRNSNHQKKIDLN